MTALHEQHGPMFRWRFLGRRTVYVGGAARAMQASRGDAGLRWLPTCGLLRPRSAPCCMPAHKRRR